MMSGNSSNTISDNDDIVDVSSEDDEIVTMTELVNNMVNKLKNSTPEQLNRLNQINSQLLTNCSSESVKPEEVD